MRALIESYRSNWDGIRHRVEEALAALPAEDSMWRALVAILLGDVLMLAGDMGAAHKACFEAARWFEAVRSPFYELFVNLKLAITLRERGMLADGAAAPPARFDFFTLMSTPTGPGTLHQNSPGM